MQRVEQLLKVPTKKNTFENGACFTHLLTGKQCRPRQTTPTGAVLSGSKLVDQEASKTFQQMTKSDDFCFDWHFEG